MAKSLKDESRSAIWGLMLANFAFFYVVIQNDSILAGNFSALLTDFREAIPAGLGVALTGIINAQLSADAKARLVFLRWNNPLPGSEAFTRYVQSDPRVDIAALEKRYSPLPTDPSDQNRLWYRLYKSVDSEPAVIQVHRAFLFTRDYVGISVMLGAVLGVTGFFQIPSTTTALAYLGLLLLQYALVSRAARNHGRRFVTSVLALTGARQEEGVNE